MHRLIAIFATLLCALALAPTSAVAADLSVHAAKSTAEPLSGMTFRTWRVGELSEDGHTLAVDGALLPDFGGSVDLADVESAAKGAEDLLDALQGVAPTVVSGATDGSGDVVFRDLADGVWLVSAEPLVVSSDSARDTWSTVPTLISIPTVDSIVAKPTLSTEPAGSKPTPETQPEPESQPQVVPVVSKMPQTGVLGLTFLFVACAGLGALALARRLASRRS